jgi:cytochrome P450
MGETIWYGQVVQAVRSSCLSPERSAIGDIVHYKAAGRNIFILNSPQDVHELLEKRANIYSDRPVLPLAGEIMGFDRGTVLAQHGARHKTSRRLLAQTMGKSQSKRFWSLQEWQTARFLQRLEETPDELINHLRW